MKYTIFNKKIQHQFAILSFRSILIVMYYFLFDHFLVISFIAFSIKFGRYFMILVSYEIYHFNKNLTPNCDIKFFIDQYLFIYSTYVKNFRYFAIFIIR